MMRGIGSGLMECAGAVVGWVPGGGGGTDSAAGLGVPAGRVCEGLAAGPRAGAVCSEGVGACEWGSTTGIGRGLTASAGAVVGLLIAGGCERGAADDGAIAGRVAVALAAGPRA